MKILIIGSNAREHIIAKTLKRSKHHPQLFCFGNSRNPGIQSLCENYCVGNILEIEKIAEYAASHQIDFAIIGPEAPLEKGLADLLWQKGFPTIGPQKNLARIETSKSFARDLLKKYHISGLPLYQTFHNLIGVKNFLEQLGENNYVIKADNLMGGKGVKVAGDHLHSLQEAYQFCQELHDKNISFVIEEKFIGQEFSFMCFCDGERLIPMPLVQDHKRAYINDKGPNTGGMGSYSDANHLLPFLTQEDYEAAFKINKAVIKALMQECGEKYIGILYGSFIATKDGVKLIEFNARFGDPEVMNVLSLLETDFVDVCQQMISGNLSQVKFANLATVCKYTVPEGYPDHPVKNEIIDISAVSDKDNLYLAAVDLQNDQLIETGSRTAAVIGIAKTIKEAEQLAEKNIQQIKGKLFHREDIGRAELIEKRIQHMKALRESIFSN